MSANRPALLFDLDGTIVETDALHFEAFRLLLTRFGTTLDRDTFDRRILGRANPAIFADLLPQVPPDAAAALADEKEALYRSLVGAVQPVAGLLALLDWAAANAIPCGVVTNAPRANADTLLEKLRLADRFAVVVSGDEMADPKPHPAPYLSGLAALGGAAETSCAFEDSVSGIRSAVAAGLWVAGLTTALPGEALRAAGAHLTATDFRDPRLIAAVQGRARAALTSSPPP